MKRRTCLALVLAALLASACGGSSSSSSDVVGDLLDVHEPDVATPDTDATDPGLDAVRCSTDTDCEGMGGAGPCRFVRCGAAGACEVVTIVDHALCDDGDPCTTGDACLAGECVPGAPIACDDDDPCTDDSCLPSDGRGGCIHEPATGAPCDDGNLCTTGDACVSGACEGTAVDCACATDADCGPYDDADLCNGTLRCDAGECRVDPQTVIRCEHAWDSPCVRHECQPFSGVCKPVKAADGAACSDGNPCTVDDTCQQGACEAGEYACPSCTADAECAPFDDVDLCNGLVRCLEGRCQVGQGTVVTCPTTVDTACRKTLCQPDSGACVAVVRDDGTACSDASLCSLGDKCQGGQCIGSKTRACDDGDACTTDGCDSLAGCVFAASAGSCDDGDPCTLADSCSGGACVGTPVACDDGNPCTADTCDASGACVHAPADLPCDDGNPCTLSDGCVDGACVPGDNACPCAADADCEAFDDQDRCNGLLECAEGGCAPRPGSIVTCPPATGDPCRVSACDPLSGACGLQRLDDGSPCSDGDACSTGDACVAGVCVPGATTACGDGDPCTTDGCDPVNGCVHVPVSGCQGCAADADCLDADPCTVDTCVAIACQHAPAASGPCSDGDACTGGDHCQAGACVAGDVDLCAGQACQATATVACEQVLHDDLSAVGASSAVSAYGCTPFEFAGPERVYRFTPTVDGQVTITLGGAPNLYAMLLQDQGQGCDTAACFLSHPARLSWQVDAGVTYFVAVEGFGGAAEPFTLSVDCAWAEPEACANGDDDDRDGLGDCADPDCATDPACFESACTNGADDDADGDTDCLDTDCFFQAACTGGWSGETCEDSFVLGYGQPIAVGSPAPASRTFVRRFTTLGAHDDLVGACQDGASGPDVAYVLPLAQATLVAAEAHALGDGAPLDVVLYTAPLCLPEYEVSCARAPQAVPLVRVPAGSAYVVVDGGLHAPGPFELTVTLSAPPADEIPGQCDDGIDNDYDGVSDCDDPGLCASVPWCSVAATCWPQVAAAWPSEASTLPGSRDDASSAVSSYGCPDGAHADYWGPERAWRYVAPCDGRATALLTVEAEPDLLIDLFLLDGELACQGNACLAFAASAGGLAELGFDVTADRAYDLVADGYLGAMGDLVLSVSATCSEVCDNGVDDDLDGLTDCDDADCPTGTAACPSATELDCDNDFDEDADGLTDCDDTADCAGTNGCLPLFETLCADGLDDDLDGDTDCADVDCIGTAACPELDCTDGLDDDVDGKTDCADPDCTPRPWCSSAPACVPAASLACGVPQSSSLRANDSTRVLTAWSCDGYGMSWPGPEHAWTFVAPCTGLLPVKAARANATTTPFDLFALPGTGSCTGTACTAVFYYDALQKAAHGTVAVQQGKP